MPNFVDQMNQGENVHNAAVAANPAMAEIQDVPGLPRVLIIGGSISIGFTLPTRALPNGKANLHRIPENGQSTTYGLAQLTRWLGDGKWDVLLFNLGIWDARCDPATGLPRTNREDYEKNLREMVRRLQATGAKVLFATMTPMPPFMKGRKFDSIPERNEIAWKVMKETGVFVIDLYNHILPRMAEFQYPEDNHFTRRDPRASRRSGCGGH